MKQTFVVNLKILVNFLRTCTGTFGNKKCYWNAYDTPAVCTMEDIKLEYECMAHTVLADCNNSFIASSRNVLVKKYPTKCW